MSTQVKRYVTAFIVAVVGVCIVAWPHAARAIDSTAVFACPPSQTIRQVPFGSAIVLECSGGGDLLGGSLDPSTGQTRTGVDIYTVSVSCPGNMSTSNTGSAGPPRRAAI